MKLRSAYFQDKETCSSSQNSFMDNLISYTIKNTRQETGYIRSHRKLRQFHPADINFSLSFAALCNCIQQREGLLVTVKYESLAVKMTAMHDIITGSGQYNAEW